VQQCAGGSAQPVAELRDEDADRAAKGQTVRASPGAPAASDPLLDPPQAVVGRLDRLGGLVERMPQEAVDALGITLRCHDSGSSTLRSVAMARAV
jgi:hypothetical protein